MPLGEQDDGEAFVTEVCWHYYVNGRTQAEIAQTLGVTRLRVNQAMQKARSSGVVKVQIESPFLSRIELQEELRARFPIDKAVVAPANRESYDYLAPVGAALASYLINTPAAARWKSIGVSWGMTLQSAIRRLPQQSRPEVEIVSMIGGNTTGAAFNSFMIASGFAERFGAKYSVIAAPVYLSQKVDRRTFLSQEIFAEHFRKCEKLDAAILVAGDVSPLSFLVATGLPRDVPPSELTAAGAVGDVLARFLDADGNEVAHPLNARAIGVDLEKLPSIPDKILAAAGRHKVDIIRAAMKRGFVNTLITDDVTAELLLNKA
jgi:DNA-binding transcriptional regulator LsrR (DeoR family)